MSNQFPSYQYMSQTAPQYSQPLFPQPQGNAYLINSSLEVANVPMGAGISVAICFPENLVYLKTMQNGTPVFKAYRLTAYTEETKEEPKEETQPINSVLEEYDKRIKALEAQIKRGGRLDELL